MQRQSTCVAIGGRAVLIEGPPGAGKSALALELIDRGAALIGDDSVELKVADSHLLASPHPRTRGLLEVRNLGLLSFPVCGQAAVGLVIFLDPEAPRFIEKPQETVIEGIRLPRLSIWPGIAPLAIKVELAMARYGLPG